LEPNSIITKDHILPLKWNWPNSKESFEVIGFSTHLDAQFKQDPNTMYHLRTDKTIKLLESSIIYDEKSERGVSGGPIVINEDGVFKLIGLHQGFHINFSRGVLFTSVGKNPMQILN